MKKLFCSSVAASIGLCFPTATVLADDSSGWEFSVAPLYLWGKSINGTSSIAGMEAPLEVDFKDDALENLEAAFAIHFEAKKENLTLFAEYNYAKLDPTSEMSLGPISISADIEFEDLMFELGAAYTFADSGSTQWEVLGGVRYLDQEINVELDTPIPELPTNIGGEDDWWHPFGGLRVTTAISENWKFVGRADAGYRDSDNKAYHLSATFDYRFRDWGSFFAGYRHLYTDYDNGKSGLDGYAVDTDQGGPIVGLNFYW
ncbi:MAG: DUF481 domain-containing protein [Halioglobus sp.]